jgi:hypothetical protein
MKDPYFVASTDRYAAQYGACVVWFLPSIGVGEKWFNRFQFFCSHWQKPIALASERRCALSPDSRITCARPMSEGTPKRS